MGSLLHLLDRRTRHALDGLHPYLVEPSDKEVSVFGVDDGLYGGTQHLHSVFLQHTFPIEFHPTVQRRLPTKREQDAVGSFLLDDALHEIGRHRLEIDGVSHVL